jgi:peptide/nickel transport system permease protein
MTNVTTPFEAEQFEAVEAESQWRLVLRRFMRHRLAMVNLFILIGIFAASILAPIIAPFPLNEIEVSRRFVLPGTVAEGTGTFHLLGTNELGQDYFTQILYAARVSLTVAVVSTIISTILGLILGLIAGYFGGWVDIIITRFVEFVSTFPLFIILLILVAVLLENDDFLQLPDFMTQLIVAVTSVRESDARTIAVMILALGLLRWTPTARLMRGMVFSVREQPFIESSRALGGSNLRIIARHVFPNAYPPLIVDFTLGMNDALVLESSLSFLGFGIQGTPTWGNMLAFTRSYMFQEPWTPLVAGLPILLTSLAINYVGDGLRDALDPRQKL